jgi:hypothetical protein
VLQLVYQFLCPNTHKNTAFSTENLAPLYTKVIPFLKFTFSLRFSFFEMSSLCTVIILILNYLASFSHIHRLFQYFYVVLHSDSVCRLKNNLGKYNPVTMNCIPIYLSKYLAYSLIRNNMKTICRLSILLISFLSGCNYVCSQTTADIKMGEILNGGDLFQLRTQYPLLKDSVSIEMI